MDELKNNPQIIELLETLEENGMHKEKGEVSALVSYIGDMEHTLSAMLVEMQEMRKEVNMIHNSSVKAKCENLIQTADGKISQGTVYRNLSCLSEDGEILHIKVPGADRYDLRTDLHYHIICLKCGKVIDIPFNYLSDPDEKVANATGYTVFRHRAVFEGICPECKTENNI